MNTIGQCDDDVVTLGIWIQKVRKCMSLTKILFNKLISLTKSIP